MEKTFNIDFDSTKNDLSLSLQFFGAMNVGFAMKLFDKTTNANLWSPSIRKDSLVDSLGNINIKKDFDLMNPILPNIETVLKIKCKCRGLDVSIHPRFLIVASFLQNGATISHSDIDGDLKTEVIDVTFVINFKRI